MNAGSAPVYVGFWARFLAFLIDSLIASLLLLPLGSGLAGLDPAAVGAASPEELSQILNQLLADLGLKALILGILFIALWKYFGATPGKMLFKGKIVTAGTLQPPGNMKLVIRYLAYIVSLLPFGLGFFWIGFDQRKQGWHDKLAGTVVIRDNAVGKSSD